MVNKYQSALEDILSLKDTFEEYARVQREFNTPLDRYNICRAKEIAKKALGKDVDYSKQLNLGL